MINTHYKWPFSIAMLNYQRVCLFLLHPLVLMHLWPDAAVCLYEQEPFLEQIQRPSNHKPKMLAKKNHELDEEKEKS
jgi:hypothetical protein